MLDAGLIIDHIQKGRKGKDRNIKWFNIVENHNLKYDINIIFESDNRDECLKKEIN